MTTKTDPLAQIENAQKILAKGDASLDALEEGKGEVLRLIADAEAEREELGRRRTIELTAASPAGELDKRLNVIEQRERAIARRLEIGRAVLDQLALRIDDALEEERLARQRAAYDEALELHDATARRVKAFLDRVAPEARAVLQAYAESEAAVAAVNKDRPAGCLPIRSIEAERQGQLLPPRIIERRFQGFVHQGQLVGEMGKVEAFPHQGHWVIYKRSNAIQGDLTIGPCTLVDYIESTVEKYEAPRLEALASALRVPAFDAPAPKLGRPERRPRRPHWRSAPPVATRRSLPLPLHRRALHAPPWSLRPTSTASTPAGRNAGLSRSRWLNLNPRLSTWTASPRTRRRKNQRAAPQRTT